MHVYLIQPGIKGVRELPVRGLVAYCSKQVGGTDIFPLRDQDERINLLNVLEDTQEIYLGNLKICRFGNIEKMIFQNKWGSGLREWFRSLAESLTGPISCAEVIWPTVKRDAVGIMKLDLRLMLDLDILERCCPFCTANHG